MAASPGRPRIAVPKKPFSWLHGVVHTSTSGREARHIKGKPQAAGTHIKLQDRRKTHTNIANSCNPTTARGSPRVHTPTFRAAASRARAGQTPADKLSRHDVAARHRLRHPARADRISGAGARPFLAERVCRQVLGAQGASGVGARCGMSQEVCGMCVRPVCHATRTQQQGRALSVCPQTRRACR